MPLHRSRAVAARETIGSGRCDRRRRGPTVRLALIVIGLLAMTGGARAQDLPAPPLIVGSEENYPPFATGDSDATAGGFTVELWRAVAAEQRLTYTIRVRPFAQLLAEFKAGQIDVLINLARSDERRTFASFSVPHVIVRGAIFVRKGDSRIASEADLTGASIIVIRADLADDYAESNGWGPQLVRVDDAADGLRLLASGEHDAMLLGKLAGLQTLQQLRLDNVRALGPPAGFAQTFSFAVHKDHPELLATINEGLAVVKSTGVYDGLYERWFGVFEPRQLPPRHLLKYLGALAMLMLIVVIAFAVRDHERKKGAGRLRASEERLRLALSAARQGLYDLDVESGQCIVSPEYALMLGYDPENFQETRTAWLARMHPDDRDAAEAVYTAYLADQRDDYRVEFRQRTKDGGWIWVLSLGSLTARTANGRPLRLLGTHTDITTR